MKLVCQFIILFFFISFDLGAQSHISYYTYFGETQSSEGIYLKSSLRGQYKYKEHNINASIENSIIGSNTNVLSAIRLHVDKGFNIKSKYIKIKAFYLWNKPGKYIREHNWGITGKIYLNKITAEVGPHFRTLYYKEDIGSNIHENWNIIYDLSYYIRNEPKPWNIAIAVTNIDYFLLSQETNPSFYIRGIYNIKKKYSAFLEGRYKSSGSLNASVHYFGYSIKTGIRWNLKK